MTTSAYPKLQPVPDSGSLQNESQMEKAYQVTQSVGGGVMPSQELGFVSFEIESKSDGPTRGHFL